MRGVSYISIYIALNMFDKCAAVTDVALEYRDPSDLKKLDGVGLIDNIPSTD